MPRLLLQPFGKEVDGRFSNGLLRSRVEVRVFTEILFSELHCEPNTNDPDTKAEQKEQERIARFPDGDCKQHDFVLLKRDTG